MENTKFDFSPGDAVTLKNSKTEMTINAVYYNGAGRDGNVRCAWFEGNNLKEAELHQNTLDLYRVHEPSFHVEGKEHVLQEKFIIGDTVTLITGGPDLIVNALHYNALGYDGTVSGVWFVGSEKKTAEFHQDALQLKGKAA